MLTRTYLSEDGDQVLGDTFDEEKGLALRGWQIPLCSIRSILDESKFLVGNGAPTRA